MELCGWGNQHHMILCRNGLMKQQLEPNSKEHSPLTSSIVVLLSNGSSMPWLKNNGHFLRSGGGVGGLIMSR
ncbi:hypothetical protein ID866_9023 [Astraeus odoratus]|nr:hypothetical protein ID866_9023 [Astraeus odoratus]